MLKEIIDASIKPNLKQCGFKKSGFTWNKSSNDMIQVINFQLSRFNKADEETFTINLGIFNPEIWKSCWQQEIPKIIHEEDCFPRIRIGDLLNVRSKESNDQWWKCTPGTDEVSLAQELIDLISLKCLPFLEHMLDVHNVINFYADNVEDLPPIEKIYLAIINSKIGYLEAAESLLEEVSTISSSWAQKVIQVRAQLT